MRLTLHVSFSLVCSCRATECIGAVAAAVGQEKFAPFLKGFLDMSIEDACQHFALVAVFCAWFASLAIVCGLSFVRFARGGLADETSLFGPCY